MTKYLHVLLIILSASACGQQPPSIDFGKAECAHCRMNVVDRRYGAVLVTRKGRQYVFDGIECMVPFVEQGMIVRTEVKDMFVCDHAHPGRLLDATKASYAHGDGYKSPMRGDVAAFSTLVERDSSLSSSGGVPLDWEGAWHMLSK